MCGLHQSPYLKQMNVIVIVMIRFEHVHLFLVDSLKSKFFCGSPISFVQSPCMSMLRS
jgi:hypothetical protein